MSETEQSSQPSPQTPSEPVKFRLGPVAIGVVALLVLGVVLYFTVFRTVRGLYGQLMVDGAPAAGAKVDLLVVPADADPTGVTAETDSEGFFTIELAPGSYRLESPASQEGFVRVNGEELEMIAARSPLNQAYEVNEGLVTLSSLRVSHPGEVIGPLEGDNVMPDAKLRWKPYPNAERYVIQLGFTPEVGKTAMASVYLPGDAQEWGFSLTDEVGRPTELEIFTALAENHPQAAFMPGTEYRWRLTVFAAANRVKDQAGPFRFRILNTEDARKVAAESTQRIEKESAERLGTLAGLVTEGRDVVRNATFHVNLIRTLPETGENQNMSDVPVKTDEYGRFAVTVPPGQYRFVGATTRTGDTLYARSQSEVTIVTPGSSSALFDVQAGQYTQVPDIVLRSRLKIAFPQDGDVVSRTPTISWESYPDANRYQLTLTYVDETGRPTSIAVKLLATESVTLDKLGLTRAFTKEHDHPVDTLKPGATYRIQVIAFKEPKRKQEWDVKQPPPPWVRLSESKSVTFSVEK